MTKHTETVPESRAKTILRKVGTGLVRLTVTAAAIAAAFFAVQFGAAELARRADAAPSPTPAATVPVAASDIVLSDSFQITRAFVGQVEPQRTVAASFELSGRLLDIKVDEGDLVTEGQVLASQDTRLLQAEKTRLEASRNATQAQLRFAEQTVARNDRLNRNGFASQAGLDEATARQDELNARIAETNAALSTVEIQLEKSVLRAPFGGRVTERMVDGGETLGPGQHVLSLIELGAPQARVGVPLDRNMDDLQTAKIKINGQRFDARLITLRPDIDPVTRTRTALFEIIGFDAQAFGQTASLLLSQEITAKGLWVPVTSLKEGVRGQWTMLVVDPDNIVRAAPIEVLHAEGERVYVRGAFPQGSKLIDDGPQRVTIGQKVTVTPAG